MKKKNKMLKHLQKQNNKVVGVTKNNYTLENGDVIEHTFEIDDDMSVEEFQLLLDDAKNIMINLLNNIEEKLNN